jgi:hypothetical protein
MFLWRKVSQHRIVDIIREEVANQEVRERIVRDPAPVNDAQEVTFAALESGRTRVLLIHGEQPDP